MKEYEALIILNPELEADALSIAIKEALDILKKYECELANVDEWGKRPLSYDISKKQQGIYYLVRFKTEAKHIDNIKKDFKLNENILRAMITLQGK